jgi:Domain of unknown function (DUF1330)
MTSVIASQPLLRYLPRGGAMAKGYWVVFYRSVSNAAALTEYAKLSQPKVFEGGVQDRSVVIEFDSVTKAIAAYESPAYQAALSLLKGAAERDVRILEGVS